MSDSYTLLFTWGGREHLIAPQVQLGLPLSTMLFTQQDLEYRVGIPTRVVAFEGSKETKDNS